MILEGAILIMLCQHCGVNEATTYYKQNVNGQVSEMHLCSACAQKLTGGFGGLGFSPVLQSFWGDGAVLQPGLGGGRRCRTCGKTESELRRTARAGCADCYRNFSDILTPYIQKLHGSAAHVGAAPQQEQERVDPVAALRTKLDAAIASEAYEEAARLRDEIRRLEGEQ